MLAGSLMIEHIEWSSAGPAATAERRETGVVAGTVKFPGDDRIQLAAIAADMVRR